MNSCAAFLKCFFFLFFGFQLIHIDDPLTCGPAPFSASMFNSRIPSPPSRCDQCAEYSARISDLEVRLTLAKCQAQMAFDKASKTSVLTKQVSILGDEVSRLTAKILHHEECNSFILGIIESAYEMLRCKFPLDLSFSLLLHCYFYDILCPYRHLLGLRC
jgi:hypothetical protein